MRLFLVSNSFGFCGVIYDANGQIEQADLKRLTESVVEVGRKTSL